MISFDFPISLIHQFYFILCIYKDASLDSKICGKNSPDSFVFSLECFLYYRFRISFLFKHAELLYSIDPPHPALRGILMLYIKISLKQHFEKIIRESNFNIFFVLFQNIKFQYIFLTCLHFPPFIFLKGWNFF